ncbi:MAG: prepilin-type N-terminal cleavage/methylation domain-containing protein [Candidatus Omnitrophica bacterium]|nr:prepilin-type N-terminal cleavage/methylation domain-containing protein [Candidatus Omnitrophota bacterium]
MNRIRVACLQGGFTLIELLIVVAIIGILAAIAVPNFLNAQVRAKVAKVKSDFKAIATAQEMYHLDHNCYAPAFKLSALTSPQPYMSSVPQDIFPPRYDYGTAGGQGEAGAKVSWYRYVLGSRDPRIGGSADLRIAHCADYWAYFPPFLLRSQAVSRATAIDCPTQWLVKSFGTNVNMPALCGNYGDDCTFRYDPTNGLVSIGDIAIFGPGGMVE